MKIVIKSEEKLTYRGQEGAVILAASPIALLFLVWSYGYFKVEKYGFEISFLFIVLISASLTAFLIGYIKFSTGRETTYNIVSGEDAKPPYNSNN